MMHHPNMHHQAMSGHPPQHMAGHQGMPGHHQMPPHQLHRENRHVTLTRVPLGPSGGGHGHGHGHAHGHSHGQALGALGGVAVHPAPAPAPPRPPPHAARAMHHPPQHHAAAIPPQQMKPMRRPYGMGGAYGPGAGVLPPPYPPQPRHQPPPHHPHAVTYEAVITAGAKMNGDVYTMVSGPPHVPPAAASEAAAAGAAEARGEGGAGASEGGAGAGGDSEAARPAPPAAANSKEKTPMCLVNELARYNKIKHQYRLTSETGPAHKKVFTVTLRLGDTEEYTAEGSSIKRAQHAAASTALGATSFPPPPPRAPQPHAPAHAHHRHSGDTATAPCHHTTALPRPDQRKKNYSGSNVTKIGRNVVQEPIYRTCRDSVQSKSVEKLRILSGLENYKLINYTGKDPLREEGGLRNSPEFRRRPRRRPRTRFRSSRFRADR
ncbi:unnamed protein product [Diatraea saccharalis]|uniref:DRBM domain-containing protein n=1 Tax=Diatraea saccharalis TaxID=40085 RepID=A0A9N9RHV8_9NEOP|nr:unnamed protein product [Diatraea saccharalis]